MNTQLARMVVAVATMAAALGTIPGMSACNEVVDLGDPAGLVHRVDMAWPIVEPDLASPPVYNECGDTEPQCIVEVVGPPFVLGSDPNPNLAVHDNGVRRDTDGRLGLAEARARLVVDHLWVANNEDPRFAGTVSKIDANSLREVARYPSVTCLSLKGGGRRACDGTSGCCALDDWDRYRARNQLPEPRHQAVQTTANDPSRTAIDFRGDAYVSNRAFGGQSSVTKFAGDTTVKGACPERNGAPGIQTSSDDNVNGFIDVDCNGDGMPDDIESVAKRPCINGAKQEYFGLDDECVLWTTNTFKPKAVGRPLALISVVDPSDPFSQNVDAWAGSYATGTFARIDGLTGLLEEDVQLPDECWKNGTGPYGAVIDAGGIAWSVDMGKGKLCYFDARLPSPMRVGVVRDPMWGAMEGYGVTLDRNDHVWVGGAVARYVPDRESGWSGLANGWWTRIANTTGFGLAADSRSQGAFFVWSCDGAQTVLQIPASGIPPVRFDQQVIVPNSWPVIHVPCYGVGIDSAQNVWAIDKTLSTRVVVDRFGAITQPKVNGMPPGNNKCPAGDSCPNAGAYTYSDFAGFGFRNFTAPRGSYSYMATSKCRAINPSYGTRWIRAEWEAELPASSSFGVRARAGWSTTPDSSFTDWTPTATANSGSLGLGFIDQPHLQLEFGFSTTDVTQTPKLRWARLYYKCLYVS